MMSQSMASYRLANCIVAAAQFVTGELCFYPDYAELIAEDEQHQTTTPLVIHYDETLLHFRVVRAQQLMRITVVRAVVEAWAGDNGFGSQLDSVFLSQQVRPDAVGGRAKDDTSCVLLLQLSVSGMAHFIQCVAPVVAASRRCRSVSRISVTEPLPVGFILTDPSATQPGRRASEEAPCEGDEKEKDHSIRRDSPSSCGTSAEEDGDVRGAVASHSDSSSSTPSHVTAGAERRARLDAAAAPVPTGRSGGSDVKEEPQDDPHHLQGGSRASQIHLRDEEASSRKERLVTNDTQDPLEGTALTPDDSLSQQLADLEQNILQGSGGHGGGRGGTGGPLRRPAGADPLLSLVSQQEARYRGDLGGRGRGGHKRRAPNDSQEDASGAASSAAVPSSFNDQRHAASGGRRRRTVVSIPGEEKVTEEKNSTEKKHDIENDDEATTAEIAKGGFTEKKNNFDSEEPMPSSLCVGDLLSRAPATTAAVEPHISPHSQPPSPPRYSLAERAGLIAADKHKTEATAKIAYNFHDFEAAPELAAHLSVPTSPPSFSSPHPQASGMSKGQKHQVTMSRAYTDIRDILPASCSGRGRGRGGAGVRGRGRGRCIGRPPRACSHGSHPIITGASALARPTGLGRGRGRGRPPLATGHVSTNFTGVELAPTSDRGAGSNSSGDSGNTGRKRGRPRKVSAPAGVVDAHTLGMTRTATATEEEPCTDARLLSVPQPQSRGASCSDGDDAGPQELPACATPPRGGEDHMDEVVLPLQYARAGGSRHRGHGFSTPSSSSPAAATTGLSRTAGFLNSKIKGMASVDVMEEEEEAAAVTTGQALHRHGRSMKLTPKALDVRRELSTACPVRKRARMSSPSHVDGDREITDNTMKTVTACGDATAPGWSPISSAVSFRLGKKDRMRRVMRHLNLISRSLTVARESECELRGVLLTMIEDDQL